jgi:hypothetical protein
MIRGLIVAISTMVMAMGTANAANFSGGDWVNTGGYLFLGGLTAWENFDLKPINTGAGIQDPKFSTSFGFSIKGGYRFMPFLAAEIEGNFLSGMDTTIIVQEQAIPFRNFPADLTVDGGIITGNILAYLPLGRLQPYGLFGLGGSWMNLRSRYPVTTVCGPGWYWGWYCSGAYARLADGGGFVIKGGGGMDFMVTEDWALTFEATYVKPFGDLSQLAYTNFNWGVRFNF